MPDLVPMRCRTTCGRAKATASNVTHQRTAESLCHPYRPTMRWRGADLFCSRWFGNGLGLDRGKLMGLDRSGALNILAGNPTTQMPCGLAAGFLENRLPFTTFGDRSASQPIWRAFARSPSWRSAQSPLGWHLRCSWPRYRTPDRKLQLGIS